MPSDLPARREEVLQCIQKIAEAYWQALPINILKYGVGFVQGPPNVAKVMQTHEYDTFSTSVRQAECDSMAKLQRMDEVPHLAQWKMQQLHYAGESCRTEAYDVKQLHTESLETRVHTTQEEPAVTAEAVTQEPLPKRQRVEATAAEISEKEMQAQIDVLRSQNRQEGLKLQLQAEKQAAVALQNRQKDIELQLQAEKQAALELAQREGALNMRQMLWSNAQHSTSFTEALTAGSPLTSGVQTSNTPSAPFIPLFGHPLPLPDPIAPVQCTAHSGPPNKLATARKNPDFFQSQTISGRYHEWIGNGQCSSIKSQLVMKKNGLGLPSTGHTKRAVDNFRKNRDLSEAIEQLVEQGLSSEAAIVLVTKVMEDFGLRSISQQSTAFSLLRHTPAVKAETRLLLNTGKTVRAFKRAYDEERNKALNRQAM